MSDAPATADGSVEIAAPEKLREILDNIMKLEEQKKELSDDIKDAYAAAKGQGYDPKALKRIISLMKIDKAERAEANAILASYMDALGMN